MIKHIEDYEDLPIWILDFRECREPTKADVENNLNRTELDNDTKCASKMWFVNDLGTPI